MLKRTVILYSPQMESGGMKPRTPPLSALTLAGPLIKEGYDVKIIDALIDKNAHENLLNSLEDAICLGITVWIGYPIKDSLEVSKLVKEKNPTLPIVWGGWFPSLYPEQAIRDQHVDFVVRGQGEFTFLELVKCLEKNKPVNKVLGIVYKEGDKVITNPERPRTPLDDIPPLPYHIIELENYITPVWHGSVGQRSVGYMSSQGCVYNCAFCADAKVYKRKQMAFSAERVLTDIKHLIDAYKVDGIVFEDTNFFVNKERLFKICEGIIKNGWKIKWSGCGRANQILAFNDEELKMLKNSGCNMITIGAESGSQKILNFLSKGIKVNDILEFSKLCKRYDIGNKFSFMIGFPNETEEDLRQTLNIMKEVYRINQNNELLIYFYTPYPGTPLYDTLKKDYNFIEPQTLEEWSKFDANVIETPWMNQKSREKLYTFLFYLQLAFLNRHFKSRVDSSRYKILYMIMHWLSLVRANNDFFRFPIERKLFSMYKRLFRN